MRTYSLLIFLLLTISQLLAQQKDIRTYPRVKNAYKEKQANLETALKQKGFALRKIELLLVAYKKEERLEAWVRTKGHTKYTFFKNYPFAENSGTLGPKRRYGDSQIPEGLYLLSYFNPWSNFHLSMKVNYPNKSDKVRGVQGSLGNNIFIHGSVVTIGCIPITDNLIKELFILAVEAKRNQKVTVLILPTKLSSNNLNQLLANKNYTQDAKILWKELAPIYQYFTKHNSLPNILIHKNGEYRIKK